MIQLGCTYKDKVTGFQGIATGHAKYISGCSQVLLMPPSKPDGSFVDGQWFDEQRLDKIGKDKLTLDNEVTPGADKPAPKR